MFFSFCGLFFSNMIIQVHFLESTVCLSQRMVEAEEYLNIHAEQQHAGKKQRIQGIKPFSMSKMLWTEGVSKLASYLWVRSKALWQPNLGSTRCCCWVERQRPSVSHAAHLASPTSTEFTYPTQTSE